MAPWTVPWVDGCSLGCGVSRVTGSPKGCAFDGVSLEAVHLAKEEVCRPRQAEFTLQVISDAEGYTKAVKLSGSGGVRLKAVASANARLSLLNEASSHRSSLSLYGRKCWTSDPVLKLKPESLPQFSEAARDLLVRQGVMAFVEVYGTHFIAGYTTAASYDALVTFCTTGSNKGSSFSAGVEADVPIPQAGGAVNINAGMGFSQTSTSFKSQQVLCIRVQTLGVDNAGGFHPVTLADLDKEMSQFGKQQGSGAKYAAITLPYSMHPFWQTLDLGSQSAEYAALLSSHVEAVVAMLNKVDYLLHRYLTAAEAEQDKQPSNNVNDMCVRLRMLQGNLNGLEQMSEFGPLMQNYIQAQNKGNLQHDQLYQLVHDSVHGIEAQLREGGWLKDGRLLLGHQAATQRTIRALLRGHCWYDYLGVHKLKPWMQPHGAVWEIREVLGMPIVDGSYCVTLRDVDTGLYLSYQGDSKVSLTLEASSDQTEIWRMEDLGRSVSDANTKQVCFRGVTEKHYYLGAALAGWVTLRTHCFKWERWSLHLQ